MTARQRPGEEVLRRPHVLGSGHPGAPYPHGLRHQPGQFRVPVGEGEIQQVTAVDGQRVEEDGGDGHVPGGRGHVHPGTDPPGDLLERTGPLPLVERDDLAVQDEPLARQRPCRRRHFGQPVGDVVQGAGVHAHRLAVAVHLDADAVQLLLDRRRPQFLHRLGDRGGAVRQHRQHGAPHGETEPPQRPGAVRQQGTGHGLQRARQHHRPPHLRRRRPGRPRQPFHGDRVQGPLPHLAAEQTEQEPLLVLGRRAQQLPDQQGPLGLRTGAGHPGEPAEQGVDGADGQGRPLRRGDRPAQGLPAHADPALRQPTRQIRDDDGDVGRLRVPEQLREQRDLPGPRRGGGDLLRHTGQSGQQHAAMVLRGPAFHTRVAEAAADHTATTASRSAISRSPTIAAAAR